MRTSDGSILKWSTDKCRARFVAVLWSLRVAIYQVSQTKAMLKISAVQYGHKW
jgi:hypothetical protein